VGEVVLAREQLAICAQDGIEQLVPARAFFQRVFEASQKECHQHGAEVVGIGQQRQVGPVDPDQHRHGDRYEDAGNQIDEEGPTLDEKSGRLIGSYEGFMKRACECLFFGTNGNLTGHIGFG
jgi:hypothetical protein